MTSSGRPTSNPLEHVSWPTLAVAGVAVLGWLAIGLIHRAFTPGVAFLGIGWLALCLVLLFFVRAWSAAATAVPNDGFATRRDRGEDLEIEKRALLKAIKEIEFDHETGKMSDADADEIIRFYRTRAIEILKEIDELKGATGPKSPRQEIERDIEARMAVAGLGREEG